MSIVRIAGIVTVLVLSGFVGLMAARDRRGRRAIYEASSSPDGSAIRRYQ
jgi:hypothetical protein